MFIKTFLDIVTVREKVHVMKTRRFKPVVYTLHSQMNSHDQQQVFDEAKPGHRKVILSTNIAEASLTIDDVVFVIDCGKVKEKTYDHGSRISQLKVSWIAKV
jgi:HrpA-like RNA helicase